MSFIQTQKEKRQNKFEKEELRDHKIKSKACYASLESLSKL